VNFGIVGGHQKQWEATHTKAFFEEKEGPKLPYLEGEKSEFTKFRLVIGSKEVAKLRW
jgi:hypothetical protein